MRTRPGRSGRSTSSCTSFPTASSALSSAAPTPALCKAGAPQIFQIGDILQVLFFAVLFGFALLNLGERAERIRSLVDDLTHAMFAVIGIIMKAAPLGAFGAMAFTIGKYGTGSIGNLLDLILTFYAASAIFVLVVLGRSRGRSASRSSASCVTSRTSF